jgi:hypothetical protein
MFAQANSAVMMAKGEGKRQKVGGFEHRMRFSCTRVGEAQAGSRNARLMVCHNIEERQPLYLQKRDMPPNRHNR